MLRSRDSFFAQSSMNQQSYFPNPGYQQMPQYQTGPYQASGANNYFYSGPTPNPTTNYQPNYQPNYNQSNTYTEDFNNRLAKIERSLNRLDARITKLENSANMISQDVSSSMYMV